MVVPILSLEEIQAWTFGKRKKIWVLCIVGDGKDAKADEWIPAVFGNATPLNRKRSSLEEISKATSLLGLFGKADADVLMGLGGNVLLTQMDIFHTQPRWSTISQI